MAKRIGTTFGAELVAAGLTDLPFSWGDDGSFFWSGVTEEQQIAILAVYEAHDPEAT